MGKRSHDLSIMPETVVVCLPFEVLGPQRTIHSLHRTRFAIMKFVSASMFLKQGLQVSES